MEVLLYMYSQRRLFWNVSLRQLSSVLSHLFGESEMCHHTGVHFTLFRKFATLDLLWVWLFTKYGGKIILTALRSILGDYAMVGTAKPLSLYITFLSYITWRTPVKETLLIPTKTWNTLKMVQNCPTYRGSPSWEIPPIVVLLYTAVAFSSSILSCFLPSWSWTSGTCEDRRGKLGKSTLRVLDYSKRFV